MTAGPSPSINPELSAAYHELLGISLAEQPPTHYRLLGLSPFESNPTVIERAADRQVAHLRTFKHGNDAIAGQKLLSEVVKASRVLLDPSTRVAYDATLRAATQPAPANAANVAPPQALPPIPHPTFPVAQAPPAPAPAAWPTAAAPLAPLGMAPVVKKAQRRQQSGDPSLTLWIGGAAIGLLVAAAIGVMLWANQREPASSVALATNSAKPIPKQNQAPPPVVQPATVAPRKKAPPNGKPATSVGTKKPLKAKPRRTPRDPDAEDELPSSDGPDGNDTTTAAIAERVKSTLIVWQPSEGERVFGPARSSFMLMSTACGFFLGGGEQFSAHVNEQGNWTISGGGVQFVLGHFTDLKTPLRQLFEPKVEEVEWTRDMPPIKLIAAADGFAVLSGITGCFLDEGQNVRVYLKDGAWWLEGKTGFDTAGRAHVYRYVKPGQFRAEVQEYTWRPGEPAVNLIHESEGVCFLSGVGGGMHGGGECARCEIDSATGRWRFNPSSSQASTEFRCISIKFGPDLIRLASGLSSRGSTSANGSSNASSTTSEPVARTPVPTDAVEEQATTKFRAAYSDDLAKAKTVEAKQEVFRKLIVHGAASQDSTEQYVCWKQAALLASERGDAAGVVEAVNLMADVFEVNRFTTAAKLFVATGREATGKAQAVKLAAVAAAHAYRAMEEDEYAAAIELSKRAEFAAKRSGNPVAMRVADQQLRHFEALAANYAATESARKKLSEQPIDAEANLALGRFYCLFKDDWERGLPMLVAGSDPALKAQAAAELNSANISTQEIANGWWTLAESQSSEEARGMQLRAIWHYEQVVQRLEALPREELEAKIVQFWTDNPRLFFIRERKLAMTFPAGWQVNVPLNRAKERAVEGRTTHWEMHPISGNAPAVLSRRLFLPKKANCALIFEAASAPESDFVLRFRLNDKPVMPPTAVKGNKWLPFGVELSPHGGTEVEIEIVVAAGGDRPWQGEYGELNNVAIVPR